MTATVTTAPPRTLATRLQHNAEVAPDATAMYVKRYGLWEAISWSRYWDEVCDVAHALLDFGIEPGDRVAIHAENRPEWLIADVATVAVRAATVGIYPTNPADEVRYHLLDSGSRILFAEDQEQVDKALAVKTELPGLEAIVHLDDRGLETYDDPLLVSWSSFVERGRALRRAGDQLEAVMSASSPDDVMTIIYTSGTTGDPKGAMLTVGNVDFAISKLCNDGGLVDPPPSPDDVLLSYLPLCHVAERLLTEWYNLERRLTIAFAESIETVQSNLVEVQPTIFLGVPRIWEKMHAQIENRMAAAPAFKRWYYRAWMRVARWRGRRLVEREGNSSVWLSVVYAVGWVALFRVLKNRVGLRRCRHALSGAAPIAPEVLEYFMGIGVPVYESYGMTENCGVASTNRPGRVKLGTVGEPYEGMEVRLDEDTGEILMRHPAVFAGYWEDPESSRRAVDADGWLHTGDEGVWVDGRYLRITGRIKDVMITAGGKNISPSEVENGLKTSPYIKEAVLEGDRRPYVTALIGIEGDNVGEWAQQQGIPYTTYRDLTEKPEVVELIRGEVEQINQRFPRVSQVKDFRLLPKELDHEDGELTATQKVKREAVLSEFRESVESMYR